MFSLNIGKINISIYGTSHNKQIGLIIDNIPAGTIIDFDKIEKVCKIRSGQSVLNTSRKELDVISISSGYYNDCCDGSPLHLVVENNDVNSREYDSSIMRPNHADYSAFLKHGKFNDYRGGGYFSGRMTILLVISGEIIRQLINQQYSDLIVRTHIKQYKDIIDEDIVSANLNQLDSYFPVINSDLKQKILDEVTNDYHNNSAYAVKLDTVIKNLPLGLGNPYFNSFESELSHMIYAIPSIKSISFGEIENLLNTYKSEELFYDGERILTNHINGGIIGGINCDSTVNFSVISKPVYSNLNNIKTVKITDKIENATYNRVGRHDTFIGNRICIIIESVTYLTIYKLLSDGGLI